MAARHNIIRLAQTNTLARVVCPRIVVPVVQRAFLSGTAFRGEPIVTPDIKSVADTIGVKAATNKVSPTLSKFTLDGKIAVVTGGARGLGNNIAEALCDVNLKALVIFDVLKEHGDEAVAKLSSKFGIPVVFHQVDVRNHTSVQEAVDATIKQFGRIDVLVASAGIADSNLPAEGYDIEMFRRLVDINLTGTFVCAQAVGNTMINSNAGGSMIFIASMSGHIVNWPQQQSCYNASKAAVIMLGKSLAAEWAGYKIRVNSISPGYMDTALNRVPALDAQKKLWKERTPMGRLGGVDELNNLAVFLASDASTYMTGTDIIIDGGYTAW
jgi:NAD(P)-dependent dehydrogenase (short-subunit alcohol dehydrogenase family)